MHTIELPDKKKIIDFPSEIDEMNSDQYTLYIDLILQYISGKISEVQFKRYLIQKLLDIRMSFKYPFLSSDEKEECDASITRLSELMDCFIEEYQKDGKPVKTFKLKSVRNFLPVISGYHGPRDCFENISYCEYRTARGYFRSFAEEGNEDSLNHLVAVLYRPAKKFWFIRKFMQSSDGEIRIPFHSRSNPLLLEKRVRRIAQAPYPVRYSVFLYFSGCEDYLKTGKPQVDGVELDFSQLYKEKSGEEADKADVGMVGLLFSLAETGVFGTIEQTDNSNLWDILVRVYQVVMQMRSLEEKSKKNDIS